MKSEKVREREEQNQDDVVAKSQEKRVKKDKKVA